MVGLTDELEYLAVAGGETSWVGLPNWLREAWQIGARIANLPLRDGNVVAVSTPTQAHIATFLAAGYTLERLESGVFESRFDPGELIVWTSRTRRGKTKAVLSEFLGYANDNLGSKAILLRRFENESPTKWTRTTGHQLGRYPGKKKRIPKTSPYEWEVEPSDFTSALVGPDDSVWLGTRVRIAFLGEHSNREKDASLPLRLTSNPQAEGSLSEVLRPGNIETGSASSLKDIERLVEFDPGLVIYDGGQAFTKCRRKFSEANSLVLLDRATRRWIDEYDAIAALYSRRSTAPPALAALTTTPGSPLEILGFKP